MQEKLNQLMGYFNTVSDKSSTHMAGIACLSSITLSKDCWIIDSDATDHSTPHVHLLTHLKALTVPYDVLMPNGERVLVTHTGTHYLNDKMKLLDVLLVPKIKFNLISVGKLTADSNFTVSFTKKKCDIQDLATMTSLGTGEYLQDLYQLQANTSKCLSVQSTDNLLSLWHIRLGHAPYNKVCDTLSAYVPNITCKSLKNNCDLCPLARQSRLPFSISTTNTKALFKHVHADIWGPYKVPTITGSKYFLTIVEDFSRSTWVYLMTA
ncbi:unnamed protein product [Rhodiola kirilowii]